MNQTLETTGTKIKKSSPGKVGTAIARIQTPKISPGKSLPAPTKTPRKTRTSKTTKAKTPLSQILRVLAGLIIGGIIPAVTYHVAHYQVQVNPMLWLGVAGGLAYSAPTVAEWFSNYATPLKAWGFVIALEIAMTFTAQTTALPALGVLIAINAFVLARKFSEKPQVSKKTP